MGLILIFIVVQVVVAGIVIFVLTAKLKKELIEAATENLNNNLSANVSGDIVVISADPLEGEMRARIESIVKRKAPTAALRFDVDKSLKSGVIIHIGQIILDFSLANRLKKLTS